MPLPSKWLIQFCPPIPTAHLTEYADDPMVVYNLADQVRETIQATLHDAAGEAARSVRAV